MSTLVLAFAGLLISLLLFFDFFKNKKIVDKESSLFSNLLSVNLIYSIIGTLIAIYGVVFEKVWLMSLLMKVHMVFSLIVIILISFYVLLGCDFKKNVGKSFFVGSIIMGCGFSLLTLFCPINVGEAGAVLYGNGVSYIFNLTAIVLFLLETLFLAAHNLSKNKNFEYIFPFILLVCLYGVGLVLRGVFKGICFENFLLPFMLLVIYMVFENPVLKENKTLKYSNHDREEFLNTLSKDIRMPLNSMVGLTENVLNKRNELSNEIIQDISDISRCNKNILEIVDRIQVFNSNSKIVEEEYNISELIHEHIRDFQVNNNKANVTFTYGVDSDLPYLLNGDITIIKRILFIILNKTYQLCNAGNVDFKINSVVNNDKCQLTFKVMCTTIGSYVDYSEVKHLVKKMNGTFEVLENDKYFEINVSLPQSISSIEKYKLNNGDKVINGLKRILVVDDNLLNIKVISKTLTDFGFDVDYVENGKDCIAKIESGYVYDLILMDIMMPELSGEDTFKALCNIDGFRTPVICLTADCEAGAKEKYLSEGFADYIVKPFNREQVKMKLELLFGEVTSVISEAILEPAPIVEEVKPTFVENKIEVEEILEVPSEVEEEIETI